MFSYKLVRVVKSLEGSRSFSPCVTKVAIVHGFGHPGHVTRTSMPYGWAGPRLQDLPKP